MTTITYTEASQIFNIHISYASLFFKYMYLCFLKRGRGGAALCGIYKKYEKYLCSLTVFSFSQFYITMIKRFFVKRIFKNNFCKDLPFTYRILPVHNPFKSLYFPSGQTRTHLPYFNFLPCGQV